MSVKEIFYAIFGEPNFLRRLQWPHLAALITKAQCKQVVDIGAASLILSSKIKKLGVAEVYAVDLDFDKDAIQKASAERIELIVGDAQERLPIKEGAVDCILLSSVLHMVPDPEAMLSECRRILCQKGRLVLSVPNHYIFVPRLFNLRTDNFFRSRILSLPCSYSRFLSDLSEIFYVGGPRAYYSYEEIKTLLENNGFTLTSSRISPGYCGSLLWETAVVLSYKFGSKILLGLFFLLPIAIVLDFIISSNQSSEHIIEASRVS